MGKNRFAPEGGFVSHCKHVANGIWRSIQASGRSSLTMVIKTMSNYKKIKEKVYFHVSILAGVV